MSLLRKVSLKNTSADEGGGAYRSPFKEFEAGAFDHYDMTVAMLNKTMGLCLR